MFLLRNVAEYTSKPLCMGRRQTLEEALRSMKAHGVDYVVVVERGCAVGVSSRHDLALADSISNLPAEGLTVEDAMMTSIYEVEAQTPVAEVLRTMALEQRTVAVVTEGSAVKGVFSAMDGIRMLAMALEQRGRRPPKMVEGSPSKLTAVC